MDRLSRTVICRNRKRAYYAPHQDHDSATQDALTGKLALTAARRETERLAIIAESALTHCSLLSLCETRA